MAGTSPTYRVAIAGLSASPSGVGWVNKVHLPYLKSRSDVEITAVIGRTVAGAEAAIAANALPPSVKAYGSAQDAAEAGNIDLVIVGVPAPAHKAIIQPFLKAKASMFVEWPIDVNHGKSKEIADAAHSKGAKTVVGLQGRFTVVSTKLAEIISSGRIGKVLAVSVTGGVPNGGQDPVQPGLQYTLDKDSGATTVDIHLAHLLECLAPAVGRLTNVTSNLRTKRPITSIVDPATGEVVQAGVAKTAPDQISVSGDLDSGAFLSLHIHGGANPSARISVIGETGEVQLSAPALLPWINAPFPWTLTIRDASGTTEETVQESVQQAQVAVNRLWDAFFDGTGAPSFEEAVQTHRVIDAVWRSDREGRRIELLQGGIES